MYIRLVSNCHANTLVAFFSSAYLQPEPVKPMETCYCSLTDQNITYQCSSLFWFSWLLWSIPHPQCLDQMWGISPPSASCMPGSTKCGTGYRYMSHKSHTASFLTCIFNFESFRKFILWGISFPLRFPFSWFLASIIFQSSWLTTYGPGCLHALSQN